MLTKRPLAANTYPKVEIQGWWEQIEQVIRAYDLAWYKILAVIGVGLIAGFINTLAGSGSLLTLPLLIFLGLPPNVANGTNRIAILLQNVVGVSLMNQLQYVRLNVLL